MASRPDTSFIRAYHIVSPKYPPFDGSGTYRYGSRWISPGRRVVHAAETYSLAVLAAAHALPIYCVAPISTVDLSCASGDEIPIEERDAGEVLAPYGQQIAPAHFRARNPAFDITPARYFAGIITERGIARPPLAETLPALAAGA